LTHPVRQYRLLMFTNRESLSKTKPNLIFRMDQKLSSKLLFRSSPNADGFYTFYISQGSVATQLRCDDLFSTHFTTIFFTECSSEKKLKIDQYLAKIWTKLCGLLFIGPPCIFQLCVSSSCCKAQQRSSMQSCTNTAGADVQVTLL